MTPCVSLIINLFDPNADSALLKQHPLTHICTLYNMLIILTVSYFGVSAVECISDFSRLLPLPFHCVSMMMAVERILVFYISYWVYTYM